MNPDSGRLMSGSGVNKGGKTWKIYTIVLKLLDAPSNGIAIIVNGG